MPLAEAITATDNNCTLDRWDLPEGARPTAQRSSEVPEDIHHDEQHYASQNKRRRGLLLFLIGVLVGAVAAAIAIPLSLTDNDNDNERDISGVPTTHAPSTETTPVAITGVTMTELQQRTAEDDCWVAFYGTVYDITEYAPTHPGWASIIYDVCGQDGTLSFEAFHPQSYLDRVSKYIVGSLEQEDGPLTTPTPVPQPTGPSTLTLTTQEPIDPFTTPPGERIDLPAPITSGGFALTESLAQRRSVRSYSSDEPLSLTEISQLLWAAQGETSGWKRTAPSAGALYPLELYLLTASGFYHYNPDGHHLTVLDTGDLRAALSQEYVAVAPATFVLTGVYGRTEQKYGGRAERYVQLEAGHACQNLLLQAVAIGFGAVSVGAFDDDEVQAVLGLPQDHKPLYLIPVGRPQ